MTIADLYDDYAPMLHRYALRLAGHAEWAEDLVQETLLRSMMHLQLLALLNRRQCEAWLCRTMKNLFLDELRQQRMHQAVLEEWEWEEIAAPVQADISWLMLLDTLPATDRRLIEQRYLLGMTSAGVSPTHSTFLTLPYDRGCAGVLQRLRSMAAEEPPQTPSRKEDNHET